MKQPTDTPQETKSELLAQIRLIEHELAYNKNTHYTFENLMTATHKFNDITKKLNKNDN